MINSFNSFMPMDPNKYAQMYAQQNNISVENAITELKEQYGEPTQNYGNESIFPSTSDFSTSNNFDSFDFSDFDSQFGEQNQQMVGGIDFIGLIQNFFASFGQNQQQGQPFGQDNGLGGMGNNRPQFGMQQGDVQGQQNMLEPFGQNWGYGNDFQTSESPFSIGNESYNQFNDYSNFGEFESFGGNNMQSPDEYAQEYMEQYNEEYPNDKITLEEAKEVLREKYGDPQRI